MSEILKGDIEKWSAAYSASPERRLAALALAKADLNDAAYDVKGSFRLQPLRPWQAAWSILCPTMLLSS